MMDLEVAHQYVMAGLPCSELCGTSGSPVIDEKCKRYCRGVVRQSCSGIEGCSGPGHSVRTAFNTGPAVLTYQNVGVISSSCRYYFALLTKLEIWERWTACILIG